MATIATAPQSASRSPWLRSYGKTAIFGFIGLMTLYVLQHNERFIVDHQDPIWQHFEPFKWLLLPHGLAGALALILGPFQFSDRLRKQYAKFHRVSGRFYVGSVLVAAPVGVYIQYLEKIPTFTFAVITDASLWLSTTLIAMFFILRGNVAQHRQWMTRSFACAIIFLEVRVISGLAGLDPDLRWTEAIVWFCLPLALLAADVIIQIQDMPKKAATKSASSK
jgi:uncharacterized membrane protein